MARFTVVNMIFKTMMKMVLVLEPVCVVLFHPDPLHVRESRKPWPELFSAACQLVVVVVGQRRIGDSLHLQPLRGVKHYEMLLHRANVIADVLRKRMALQTKPLTSLSTAQPLLGPIMQT